MSQFNSGDKVICINPGRDIGLVKDEIYTVVESTVDGQNEPAVMLYEAMPPEPFHNYLAYRFRKASDIEIIENTLQEINLK